LHPTLRGPTARQYVGERTARQTDAARPGAIGVGAPLDDPNGVLALAAFSSTCKFVGVGAFSRREGCLGVSSGGGRRQ
jgi:hypothetical protein